MRLLTKNDNDILKQNFGSLEQTLLNFFFVISDIISIAYDFTALYQHNTWDLLAANHPYLEGRKSG